VFTHYFLSTLYFIHKCTGNFNIVLRFPHYYFTVICKPQVKIQSVNHNYPVCIFYTRLFFTLYHMLLVFSTNQSCFWAEWRGKLHWTGRVSLQVSSLLPLTAVSLVSSWWQQIVLSIFTGECDMLFQSRPKLESNGEPT